jgi:inner membrane protein involved in colicin E2 resistance
MPLKVTMMKYNSDFSGIMVSIYKVKMFHIDIELKGFFSIRYLRRGGKP